jgi:uncharacterized delta-60 repeat protein
MKAKKTLTMILPSIIILALCMITTNAIAQPGSNDHTFNTFDDGTSVNGGLTGYAFSTAIQADGKIIVVGGFSHFNGTLRNNITRLNTDGSLDAAFNPGTGFNQAARSLAIQADGKIIVVGNFSHFNGTLTEYIARLNSDGTLDTSFDPPGTGISGYTYSTAIQADGKIIVGGEFIDFNGTTRNGIARLNSDGTLDTTFNPGTGFDSRVLSIAIQGDGKIMAGGRFHNFNGMARKNIARLNINGTIDTSFNPGTGFNMPGAGTFNSYVYSTAIQVDGKIVVGGLFNDFNGTAINFIARLNTNGTLDGAFNTGTGFDGYIFSITIQADGKIIVGGDFTTFNGTARNNIVRLNTDGTLDTTFNTSGTGFNGNVRSTAIQTDGKIIAGGEFTRFDGLNCYPSTGSQTLVVCDSTQINGNWYFTSQLVIDTLANANATGCDSIVTTTLTINDTPVNTVTISSNTITADQNGATYKWLDCNNGNALISGATAQSYTVSASGNYAVQQPHLVQQ